jgi:2-hydroxy-6-oxonona-2,4-dienedioate hydrolase
MDSGVTHNAGATEDGMVGGSDPEFRWLERGEGEPVVLLHGLMGRMDHWEAVLEYLGDQCRPMALSLPIFDARLGEVSIPELARHVARFLDALDIPRAVVGGNSLGGHVALELALSCPDRVSGLILAGSSGLFERGFTRGVPRRPTAEYVRAKLEEVVYDRALVTPSWVESVRQVANTRACALRLVRFAKAAKRDSIAERLPALRVPTLLVWGMNDVVTPPDVGRRFNALIAESRLWLLARCGHVPMLERPLPFNRVVADWLETTRLARERPARLAGAGR